MNDLRGALEELCGDELNGGFIRDLCFTVWNICHNPTHEDGSADWSTDTLPTVQAGVKRIRERLQALSAPVGEGGRLGPAALHVEAESVREPANPELGARDRELVAWLRECAPVPAGGKWRTERLEEIAARIECLSDDYFRLLREKQDRLAALSQPSPGGVRLDFFAGERAIEATLIRRGISPQGAQEWALELGREFRRAERTALPPLASGLGSVAAEPLPVMMADEPATPSDGGVS